MQRQIGALADQRHGVAGAATGGGAFAKRFSARARQASVIIERLVESRVTVRLQARARRNELGGIRDGVLLARVSAPPFEGRANEALRRLIARRAGVAPSRVTIVGGKRSRVKLVRVEGLDDEGLRDLLGPA